VNDSLNKDTNTDSYRAVNDNSYAYDFLSAVHNNPNLALQYDKFKRSSFFNKVWADRFNDYISKKKTLPLLYDPFFKKLFNGDEHRERLSRLVSSIIGQKVTVIDILPSESSCFEDSFIIMDMIVRLSDGSIANIEVQKIAALFPGERLSCYSADAIMRQYHRLSSSSALAQYNSSIHDNTMNENVQTIEHKTFSYKDMKNVHTIVLFENSNSNLISPIDSRLYFHVGTTRFNTQIDFPLLQHFHMISLDTFRKYRYSDIIKGNVNITKYDYDESMYDTPLTSDMLRDRLAYLSLFVTESVEDALAIQKIFPELSQIFDEMNEYLAKPEEVLSMFSEALRILNHNTAVLMVDEYRKKYQEMENNLKKEIQEKQKILDSQKEQLDSQKEQLDSQKEQLDSQKEQLDSQKEQLDSQKEQLDIQKEQFSIKKEQYEEQHSKDLEKIAELEAMLKEK